MIPMFLLEGECVVNGSGNFSQIYKIKENLSKLNARVIEFEIASIKDGWHESLPKDRLRCACSPMIAIIEAQKLFVNHEADVVVIHGKDHIKTDFRDKKAERNELMHMYGENGHILHAYNKLAHEFIKYWKISQEEFLSLSEAIFSNHLRVWLKNDPAQKKPDKKWFNHVTDLFRGVDCANPSVDFEGFLVIGTQEISQKYNLTPDAAIQIVGCHVEQCCEDTMEAIPKIVPYAHLRIAFEKACEQADLDFMSKFLSDMAILEIYTCYPVVPLGFLLATGMSSSTKDIPRFLDEYPLTITGGLNLSKAPWNNTTLSAFVSMAKRLRANKSQTIGGIHSIGAIGYKQAFVILKKVIG